MHAKRFFSTGEDIRDNRRARHTQLPLPDFRRQRTIRRIDQLRTVKSRFRRPKPNAFHGEALVMTPTKPSGIRLHRKPKLRVT